MAYSKIHLCECCGAEFEARTPSGKYCGEQCFKIAKRQRQKVYRESHAATVKAIQKRWHRENKERLNARRQENRFRAMEKEGIGRISLVLASSMEREPAELDS